jgi:hypothetical protein
MHQSSSDVSQSEAMDNLDDFGGTSAEADFNFPNS